MPAAALAETVERVARAASRDEVRPILTGILVSVEDSTLTMVATDSYRLSVKRTELEGDAPSAFEAMFPSLAHTDADIVRTVAFAAEVAAEISAASG